jgi:hypothetical protein
MLSKGCANIDLKKYTGTACRHGKKLAPGRQNRGDFDRFITNTAVIRALKEGEKDPFEVIFRKNVRLLPLHSALIWKGAP